jgi:hypothetical protein
MTSWDIYTSLAEEEGLKITAWIQESAYVGARSTRSATYNTDLDLSFSNVHPNRVSFQLEI